MALRFLQVCLPPDVDPRAEEAFQGWDVVSCWRDTTAGGCQVVQFLVAAEQAEPFMDRLEQAYGQAEGFRVVLLPVEATVPRPAEKSGEATAASSQPSPGGPQEPNNNTGRVSREELYSDITDTLGIDRVFLAMTVLSSVVAAVGLLRNDVAVIIGAMVIAPLLGPNVAMSLATTLGDVPLLRRAIATNVVGVCLALAVAVLVGLLVPVDPGVQAIASRTQVNLADPGRLPSRGGWRLRSSA